MKDAKIVVLIKNDEISEKESLQREAALSILKDSAEDIYTI
jgi:hypothetical protein